MSYRGVNSERLKYLLRTGLSSEELTRFFHERRKPLIMRGDKQDPPRNFKEAILRVLRFGDAGHGIFADWLHQQNAEDALPFKSQLVNYFRSIEICGLELPANEAHKLARCGLLELYSPSPSAEWLDFLTTNITPQNPDNGTDSAVGLSVSSIVENLSPDTVSAYAEWALGIRSADNIPDSNLASAARLAGAVRSGDRKDLNGLAVTDEVWSEITRVRGGTARNRQLRKQGLVANAPPIVDRDASVNYLTLDVICSPSRNPGPGPCFLDVLCFYGCDGPFALSDVDIRAVIPEEGRVILHTDAGLAVPKPGFVEAYRVEYFNTPRTIKVRVKGLGRKLYLAMYVPFPSADRNAVRQWLMENATALQGRLVVFVLADGICIRSRGDTNITAPHFDWTFDSWQELTGIEFTQATYIPAPLPNPDTLLYECSPVSVVARRLLKSLVDRKKAKLTKQQINDLSGLIGDQDVSMTEECRRRIAGNLSTLASTDPFYDDLVAEVMKSSEVQEDIEKRKEEAIKDLDDELAKKRHVVDNLRKESAGLESRVARLKAQADERAKEIRASVRKAFEQAKKRETEVLGQLALWQELLHPAEEGRTSPVPSAHGSIEQRIAIAYHEPREGRLVDVIRSVGIDCQRSNTYCTALEIARDLGLPVVICGSGALHVGEVIGRIMAHRRVCVADVGIGVIESNVLEPVLNDGESDVLVIRNANLSDVSVYAPRLLEELTEIVCRPTGLIRSRLTLLLQSTGPAALPWPLEIAQLGLKLNLASSSDGPQSDEGTWLQTLPSPLQRKVWSRIEHEAQKRSDNEQITDVLRGMLWESE